MKQNNFVGELVQKNYTEKQWREIQLGIESGVDVSIYAKVYYHHAQMRELRLGLEQGFDVHIYSDRFLYSKDMFLIRKCMELKFEVSYFLNKELNYKQKEQIFYGMLSGINYAIYAKAGYNEWKMKEVRLGMEKGFDLTPYLDTHNHNQMHQIRLGMESQNDYKTYDDVRFKQAQMAEILAGLQKGLDVSAYADFNLPIEVMRSRRISLERHKNRTT